MAVTIGNVVRAVLPASVRPIGYLTELTRNRTQGRVASGPFAGLAYVETSIGSAFIPKLLGIYERELHGAIEGAVARRPTCVVNVGSAEGYYAVGLAKLLPDAHVFAFESDPRGRELLQRMITLNDVSDRIDVLGSCDPLLLQGALEGAVRKFVVMDVEGAEDALIDLHKTPELARSELLIEMHEFAMRGITSQICSRLAESHAVEEIVQTDRSVSEFPFVTWYTRMLPKRYLEWAVSEWRPERMSWLHCIPRSVDG